MDVVEAIRGRRSIRKWSDRPLDRGTLEELLDAARLAPSGHNGQRWEIIAVTDRGRLRHLVPMCNNQAHVGEAGAFLFIVCDPEAKWIHVDPAIAMDHLTLRAHEMGLGTCWIGAFDERRIRTFLAIPDDRIAVIGMTVGYPAEAPEPRPRRQIDQLVHWDIY
jgi:nitroreductase